MRRLFANKTQALAVTSFILLAAIQGCATGFHGSESGLRHPANSTVFGPTAERPWELIDPLGQAILTNIFYADDVENRQVMPLTMPNHRIQISRLVYPTIGNPRLFVRTRENDLGIFVLRMEKDVYAQAGFQEGSLISGTHLIPTSLPSDSPYEIAFYLIKRERKTARFDQEMTDFLPTHAQWDPDPDLSQAFRIEPTQITVHEEQAGMPAVLRERKTLQVTFSKSELASVPEGLYDVGFTLTDKRSHALVVHKGFKVYETQYNAFRIFDDGPKADEYSVINVSDTQVSLGSTLRDKTVNKLAAFVNYVNTTTDPKVKNAPFILFNGDLHNSGSPLMHLPDAVLNNYNSESWMIMSILKELNFPIFLILGNHDSYCNLGYPGGQMWWETKGGSKKSMNDVVLERPEEYRTWPDFKAESVLKLLKAEQADQSGDHINIFSGSFIKHDHMEGWAAWQEVPIEKLNIITYDGFYQWQKTYGPQYFSMVFGQNRYVGANSAELRQHRRSGWGLYSSNYGGNISAYQLDWIKQDFQRSKDANQDLVFLAHHDPRGGHKGGDYPFYFKQLDFAGVGSNFTSYVKAEVLKHTICDGPLAFVMNNNKKKRDLFCTHDGLQEWMRSDKEFDCSDRIKKADGTCDACGFTRRERPYYSGYEMIDLWAKTENLRTVILGHTHFHSLEILQTGSEATSEIVPRKLVLDLAAQERAADLDPARKAAIEKDRKDGKSQVCPNNPENTEAFTRIKEGPNKDLYQLDLDKAGYRFKSRLQGNSRELVIIRVAPSANITGQHVAGLPAVLDAETHQSVDIADRYMHGFSVFDIYAKHDSRGIDAPQVNGLHYYLDVEEQVYPKRKPGMRKGGEILAEKSTTVERIFKLGQFDFDRTHYLSRSDRRANPVWKFTERVE